MSLKILRDFLNSRMYITELWRFENSLSLTVRKKAFSSIVTGSTRSFFTISRGNCGEDEWMVSSVK